MAGVGMGGVNDLVHSGAFSLWGRGVHMPVHVHVFLPCLRSGMMKTNKTPYQEATLNVPALLLFSELGLCVGAVGWCRGHRCWVKYEEVLLCLVSLPSQEAGCSQCHRLLALLLNPIGPMCFSIPLARHFWVVRMRCSLGRNSSSKSKTLFPIKMNVPQLTGGTQIMQSPVIPGWQTGNPYKQACLLKIGIPYVSLLPRQKHDPQGNQAHKT